MERCSRAESWFCIPEAEIDKPGHVIGSLLHKVIVSHFQSTYRQEQQVSIFSFLFIIHTRPLRNM